MEKGECSNTKSPPTFQQSNMSSRLHDNHTIDIRKKVKATLRSFNVIVTSVEGEKLNVAGPARKRFDLKAAKILKDNRRYVNN